MKKFTAIFILLVVAALCLPVFAFADCSSEVAEIVKAHKEVKQVEVVVYEDSCVVALKAEIDKKSDYAAFCDALKKEICQHNKDIKNVYVTGNPRVMHELRLLNKLDEADRNEEIQRLLEKFQREKRHFDMPKDMRRLAD